MKKIKTLIAALLLTTGVTFAQNVGINADGTEPNRSAMLDVKSTTKGLLPPRMLEAEKNAIVTPATGLLIYQTDGTAGYYYNSGTTVSPVWTKFIITAADGSETKVTAGTNVTVTGSGTTASPYLVNATGATTLTIGQSYKGGIIFWLDDTGQHGLIAATTDQSTGIQWYNGTFTTTNAVRNGIGAGQYNTERIIANQSTGNYATQLCANYQGGNYGDWYLPSKYELNLLYLQKTSVGGFASDYYWSSTEASSSNAWMQTFDGGMQDYYYKTVEFHVRAVRAF